MGKPLEGYTTRGKRVRHCFVQCYLVCVYVYLGYLYVRISSLIYNSIIRSFIGYSNANYALSEVRDPVRTIKEAAPLAMIFVTAIYLRVNIAYFAVVPKEDILNGGRIVA